LAYNTVELYLVYELGLISVIIEYGTDIKFKTRWWLTAEGRRQKCS